MILISNPRPAWQKGKPLANHTYDEFTLKAVQSFAAALEEAKEIWPEMIRKEAYREWASTMKNLEILDKRTRAAVIATLLPIVAIGEEVDAETALRNTELLFVALLESVARSNG